jgi:NAD-dependent dihydropyrimidine dehydrogenase PreA subunit
MSALPPQVLEGARSGVQFSHARGQDSAGLILQQSCFFVNVAETIAQWTRSVRPKQMIRPAELVELLGRRIVLINAFRTVRPSAPPCRMSNIFVAHATMPAIRGDHCAGRYTVRRLVWGLLDRSTNESPGGTVSYQIIESECISCGACEPECPNEAISEKGSTYVIDPNKCTECEGQYDEPQCAAICPVPDTCVPSAA